MSVSLENMSDAEIADRVINDFNRSIANLSYGSNKTATGMISRVEVTFDATIQTTAKNVMPFNGAQRIALGTDLLNMPASAAVGVLLHELLHEAASNDNALSDALGKPQFSDYTKAVDSH